MAKGMPVRLIGDVRVVSKPFATPWVQPLGMDTAAYAAGDAVGIKGAFYAPKRGIVQSVNVLDQSDQQIQFDIVLFDGNFTGGTNNAAFDMADEDADKSAGHITVTNADFISFADNALASVHNVGLQYVAPKGRLWFQVVTRGAPTYAAVTDLRFRLHILSDEEVPV